ncbi:MAG TPA: hypothetical protein VH374_26275 [Polyangia bacterium]|jgi:hypothetical protein|nr:hypothetical protein [Polyangia bacterium]
MSFGGHRASRAHHSEREAWELVRAIALKIAVRGNDNGALRQELLGTADTMLAQLRQGIHENPPLLIWPNPPSRTDEVLSTKVLAIEYVHAEDGQRYRHKFSAGDSLVTMDRRGVKYLAIIRADGRPLWKDF